MSSVLIIKDIVAVFLPFSANRYYWFITCYIALYIFSPFINAGVEYLHKVKKIKYFLIALIYINTVNGWLLGSSLVNENGFNLLHFIYLYVIGSSLRFFSFNKTKRIALPLIVITFSVLMLLNNFLPSLEICKRNSPLVILFSFLILIISTKVKFSSAPINSFAASVFVVYLLQDGVLGNYLYTKMASWLLFTLLLYIIGLFIVAVFIEKIRRPLFDFIYNMLVRRIALLQ